MTRSFKVCALVSLANLLAGHGDALAESHVYNAFECSRAQQDGSPYTSIGTDAVLDGHVYNAHHSEDLWLVCPITHVHATQGDTFPVTAVTVAVDDRHYIESVSCQLRCIDDLSSSFHSSTSESTTGVAEYLELSLDGTDGYVDGACFVYCKLQDMDNGPSALRSYVAEF
jgi:hypothetical protein